MGGRRWTSHAVSVVNGGGYKNPSRTKSMDREGRVAFYLPSGLVIGLGGYRDDLGQNTVASLAMNTANRWGDLVLIKSPPSRSAPSVSTPAIAPPRRRLPTPPIRPAVIRDMARCGWPRTARCCLPVTTTPIPARTSIFPRRANTTTSALLFRPTRTSPGRWFTSMRICQMHHQPENDEYGVRALIEFRCR